VNDAGTALGARAVLAGIGASPWFATLLKALVPGRVADFFDRAFAPMCHRLPERTLWIAGVGMPLCSRCAGVFAGVAAGALVARPRLDRRARYAAVAGASALMLADIALQDLGVHPVWHATRLATGFALGYALATASVSAIAA
jgi:uncharacterized membrane protein